MSKKGILKAGILGALVGSVATFFSQKENREMAKQKMNDATLLAKKTADDVQAKANETIDKATKASEKLAEGVEAAKEAMQKDQNSEA